MTRYLLDTNVLLHLVNKSQGHELIAHQLTIKNPQQLFISAIGKMRQHDRRHRHGS